MSQIRRWQLRWRRAISTDPGIPTTRRRAGPPSPGRAPRRAEEFYTRVLGLEVDRRFGHFTQLRGGNCMVALFENPRMRPMGGGDLASPLGKGHWAFQVGPADLRDALDSFRREGVPCHGPVDWGDHDCLYFLDPDGNLLEVVAYREGFARDPASA